MADDYHVCTVTNIRELKVTDAPDKCETCGFCERKNLKNLKLVMFNRGRCK